MLRGDRRPSHAVEASSDADELPSSNSTIKTASAEELEPLVSRQEPKLTLNHFVKSRHATISAAGCNTEAQTTDFARVRTHPLRANSRKVGREGVRAGGRKGEGYV